MVLGAEEPCAQHGAGRSGSAGAGASGGRMLTTSGCAVVAWALGTTRDRHGLAALLDTAFDERPVATACLEPRGACCIAAHSRVHPHHTTPHHTTTLAGAPSASSAKASAARRPQSANGMALGAMTVAVGLLDGSVALFHVHSNAEPGSESPATSPQLVATRACTLSLGPWGYDLQATGGVSCLAFSRDADALAVGYAARGVVLFDACGTLTGLWPVGAAGLSLSGGLLKGGATSLAWSDADAELLACPAAPTPSAAGAVSGAGLVCSLGVARQAGAPGNARNVCQGTSDEPSAIALLGADHVRLVRCVAAASGWRVLAVPRTYLERAWPLRTAAVRGASVAVAGARGVAVCRSVSTDELRWRFLGVSGTQYRPFRAYALHWISEECLCVLGHPLAPHGGGGGGDDDDGGGGGGGGGGGSGGDDDITPDVTAAPPLSMWLLRHDLREVLLQVTLDVPRKALWGCAAVLRSAEVIGAAAAGAMGAGGAVSTCGDIRTGPLPTGSTRPWEGGSWYGLAPRTTLVLGLTSSGSSEGEGEDGADERCRGHFLQLVHIDVDGSKSAVSVTLGTSVRLPSSLALPVGLSAVSGTAPSMREPASVRLGGPSAGEAAGHDVPPPPPEAVEAAILLLDGSVVVCCLSAPVVPTTALTPCRTTHVCTAVPAGSCQRLWHAPGKLWTLSTRGMQLWEARSAVMGALGAVVGTAAAAAAAAAPPMQVLPSPRGGGAHDGAPPMQVLPSPREVIPLAVLTASRAVLGAAFLPTPGASTPPSPHVHAQPFAHVEIRQLLLMARPADALACAKRAPFRRRYCLELLLHETLVEAAEGDARARKAAGNGAEADGAGGGGGGGEGAGASLFVHVATLVRELGAPDWCRIVAGCARKTDASHWARLFAACGDPLELLDACLEAGDVNCAAALLLPVRHVCGTKVCEHMVDKVRAAAERQRARERRDLIKQLDAFGARLRLEGDSDE